MSGCANPVFRTIEALDFYLLEFIALKGMIVGSIYRYFMTSFRKADRQIFSELFESPIIIRDTLGTKYCDSQAKSIEVILIPVRQLVKTVDDY